MFFIYHNTTEHLAFIFPLSELSLQILELTQSFTDGAIALFRTRFALVSSSGTHELIERLEQIMAENEVSLVAARAER